MMTTFVFVATFVPKIPIPFALGRRGNFFSGDVLRAANWNFKRNNRFGIGRFLEWLSDMDYTDDFNQGAEAEIFWRLRGKSFLLGLIAAGKGLGGGLHIGGRVPLRQLERGACVDAGLANGGGDKYVRHDNFKRGDKKSRW